MSDQPKLILRLAAGSLPVYDTPSGELVDVKQDDMLIKLLDALIASWSETMTPVEIRMSLERVRLMQEARANAKGEPTALIREVYERVFLQDVWSNSGSGEGD